MGFSREEASLQKWMVSNQISMLSVTRVVFAKANVKGTSLSHACDVSLRKTGNPNLVASVWTLLKRGTGNGEQTPETGR